MKRTGGEAAAEGVPHPDIWRYARDVPALLLVVFAVPIGLCLYIFVEMVLTGQTDDLVLLGVTVSGFLLLGSTCVALKVRRRRRGGGRIVVRPSEQAGLEFAYGRAYWSFLVAWHVYLAVGGLLGLWMAWTHRDLGDARWIMWSFVVLGATAWGCAQVVNIVRGRARRGIVTLTRDGISHRPWICRYSLRWEDMEVGLEPGQPLIRVGLTNRAPSVQVSASDGGRVSLVDAGPWSRLGGAGHTVMVKVDALQGDPAVFAHTLLWYAEHPECRDELADGRALARVREGRAVVTDLAEREAW